MAGRRRPRLAGERGRRADRGRAVTGTLCLAPARDRRGRQPFAGTDPALAGAAAVVADAAGAGGLGGARERPARVGGGRAALAPARAPTDAPAGAAARPRGRGLAGEEPVPRRPRPRSAHADDRRARHERIAAGRSPGAAPAAPG